MAKFTHDELKQNLLKAMQDAVSGPVFVTESGEPTHVLMSYSQYQQITSKGANIVQALSMPGLAEIDFEPQRSSVSAKPVDL
ncbi:type II toxin-antitoxin system prevent-host-death family antitoxin [Epibacterium ulvae]|uniref:Antitoxin n=1 Tax=Epibacterium ulvae TaxID=1156985 RepID=A0A1G5RFE9_9RHOB|nr:type II toxin-antitoxin system prevent-host-death family antitoxin [Epibacterium ulvae]SCZ72805.1 prevent-host-death family protein [Epibacterium ulvae]